MAATRSLSSRFTIRTPRVARPIWLIVDTGVRRATPLVVMMVTWSAGCTTHAATRLPVSWVL